MIKPWIGYEENGKFHAAQPDVLLFNRAENRLGIFEIKFSRCLDGFLQIEKLYAPLVRKLFKVEDIFGVVVFKNPRARFVPHPDAPKNLVEALSVQTATVAEWHLLL